jgi:hypothetical protein
MTNQSNQSGGRNIHDPIDKLSLDLLGRQDLAKKILGRLVQSDAGVLGIFGGWGTGKTSLLNLMKQLNDEQKNRDGREDLHIEVIDAWKYESTGNLLIPVIVRLQLLAGGGKLPNSWQVITRRVIQTTALTLFDAALKKGFDFDRKQIKENLEEIEARDQNTDYLKVLADWNSLADDIEETEKAFQEIIGKILETKSYRRVALFIDNLDRCSPETAVQLLDSIKIFFSNPGCVWALAMDSDVIASYIDRKYEGTAMDGYSYLDKIVQEQYHLSTPLSYEVQRHMDGFVDSLLKELNVRPDFQWKRYAHIPRVLAPRRIIKCVGTMKNYFDAQIPHNARDDTIFSLTLLYHTWPDFYERLSFGEHTHILGVLDNFREDTESVAGGEAPVKASHVPLGEKYVKDQDLTHFLRKAYLDSPDLEKTARELADAMFELRSVGLP